MWSWRCSAGGAVSLPPPRPQPTGSWSREAGGTVAPRLSGAVANGEPGQAGGRGGAGRWAGRDGGGARGLAQSAGTAPRLGLRLLRGARREDPGEARGLPGGRRSMAVEEEGLRVFQSVKIKIGERRAPPPRRRAGQRERGCGAVRGGAGRCGTRRCGAGACGRACPRAAGRTAGVASPRRGCPRTVPSTRAPGAWARLRLRAVRGARPRGRLCVFAAVRARPAADVRCAPGPSSSRGEAGSAPAPSAETRPEGLRATGARRAGRVAVRAWGGREMRVPGRAGGSSALAGAVRRGPRLPAAVGLRRAVGKCFAS